MLLFDSIIIRIVHIKVVKQTTHQFIHLFSKNQPLQCLVQLVSAESFKYGTTNVYELQVCQILNKHTKWSNVVQYIRPECKRLTAC